MKKLLALLMAVAVTFQLVTPVFAFFLTLF